MPADTMLFHRPTGLARPPAREICRNPAVAEATAEEIIAFWLTEVGPARWYATDATLDAAIRDRWLDLWEGARCGESEHWLASPRGALGYILLTDQFPRNMFRADRRAYATDGHALAAAIKMIWRRWDLRVEEPLRQFFYLPLMHSESQPDQDRCVRMMITRMPETGQDNLLHARVHREIIRRFGRFPHRNAALGRETTRPEAAFLEEGGYASVLRALQAA